VLVAGGLIALLIPGKRHAEGIAPAAVLDPQPVAA
jgi:hypothetical protein